MVRTYGYLQTQTHYYKNSKHAYHYRLKLQIKPLPTAVKTNTPEYSISIITEQPALL